MDDILSQTFHAASGTTAASAASAAMPSPPVPPPAPAPAPPPAILALVHFLLAVNAAVPETPAGLSQALTVVPMPASLDDAAAAMGKVVSISAQKLGNVLGPVNDTTPQNSPRTMLQQLLQRVNSEGGTAIARVSLQAVLVRWLEKVLAPGDATTQHLVNTIARNLDVINNLSASSTVPPAPPATPPSAIKPASAKPNKATVIALSVCLAIVLLAAIVMGAMYLKRSSATAAATAATAAAAAFGGTVAARRQYPGGGGGYPGVYMAAPPPAAHPGPPPVVHSAPMHQAPPVPAPRLMPTFAPL